MNNTTIKAVWSSFTKVKPVKYTHSKIYSLAVWVNTSKVVWYHNKGNFWKSWVLVYPGSSSWHVSLVNATGIVLESQFLLLHRPSHIMHTRTAFHWAWPFVYRPHINHVLTDIPRFPTAVIHTGWKALQTLSVVSRFPNYHRNNFWISCNFITQLLYEIASRFLHRVTSFFTWQHHNSSLNRLSRFSYSSIRISSQQPIFADWLITTTG